MFGGLVVRVRMEIDMKIIGHFLKATKRRESLPFPVTGSTGHLALRIILTQSENQLAETAALAFTPLLSDLSSGAGRRRSGWVPDSSGKGFPSDSDIRGGGRHSRSRQPAEGSFESTAFST